MNLAEHPYTCPVWPHNGRGDCTCGPRDRCPFTNVAGQRCLKDRTHDGGHDMDGSLSFPAAGSPS